MRYRSVAALILGACACLVALPLVAKPWPLQTAMPEFISVWRSSSECVVEYCPDNTCEVFVLTDPKSVQLLHDFSYLYIRLVSDYNYAKPLRDQDISRIVQRYRGPCPVDDVDEAAACVLKNLVRLHAFQGYFVRYDEGHKAVAPFSLRKAITEKLGK